MCKCHWRTSVGRPIEGTENRPFKLTTDIANICLNQWLLKEIEILKPTLLIAFGEELYQLLRPNIVKPSVPPEKLSASKTKSISDAESWFVDNGTLSLKIADNIYDLAILRHPGNSTRLPKGISTDKRLQFHNKATKQVIRLVNDSSA